jgi:transcriptional regulator of acetoin/glycerol metabolism
MRMAEAAGQMVTIAEAAELLGVSRDTIRRRLKSGALTGEQRPAPNGMTWYVTLPTEAVVAAIVDPPAEQAADANAKVVDASTVDRLLSERDAALERLIVARDDMIAELREERDAWREQATRHEEAARELRILVRNAQELSRALPATTGLDREDGSTAAPGAAGGHDQPPSPSQSPPQGLWQRLRQLLGTA